MTEPQRVRMAELLSALSMAVDLSMGQEVEHSIRACYIGQHLAQRLGLSPEEQADIYYGLLLKDSG